MIGNISPIASTVGKVYQRICAESKRSHCGARCTHVGTYPLETGECICCKVVELNTIGLHCHVKW